MVVRHVLIIYKCSRFAKTDKHTPKQVLNKTTPNATKENGKKWGFLAGFQRHPIFLLFRFPYCYPLLFLIKYENFDIHSPFTYFSLL